MSPALSESSVLQCVKVGNALEIQNNLFRTATHISEDVIVGNPGSVGRRCISVVKVKVGVCGFYKWHE